MAGRSSRIALVFGTVLALGVASFGAGGFAGECKRKTAGFYLQFSSEIAPKRPAVAGQSIPASLTGSLGDPDRGREVLISQQKGDCLSCHQVGALASIPDQGGIGPTLDGIGSRYNDGQLRQIIVNPKAYFPNTIMPSYYKSEGGAAASVLTAAEIEDLVSYIKTLK